MPKTEFGASFVDNQNLTEFNLKIYNMKSEKHGRAVLNLMILNLVVILWLIGGEKAVAYGQFGTTQTGQDSVSRDVAKQDSARFSQTQLSKGRIIKATGKLNEAYQLYEQLIEVQPGNSDALYEMALIAHELKAPEFVRAHIEQALSLQPDNGSFWKFYLDFSRSQANAENAENALVRLNELHPEEEAYYYDLAFLHFYKENKDESYRLIQEAEERFGVSERLLDAKARLLEAEGKLDEAILVLEAWDHLPNPGIGGYMMRSELLAKQKRFDEALALLEKMRSQYPEQGAMFNLSRSDVYRFQGNRKKALAELKTAFTSGQMDFQMQSSVLYTAVQLFETPDLNQLVNIFAANFPDNIERAMVSGDIYSQSQQLPLALNSYRNALESNPKLEAVWDQIFNIHMYRGDFASVIRDGKEALQHFPQSAKYHFFLGNAQFMEARQSKDEGEVATARTHLESALNLQNPGDTAMMSDIYSSLGDIYNELKMYAESDVAYEEALALVPDNMHALNNYAYYLSVRKEKLDKALEYSGKTLEQEPDNPNNLDTYAWVLYQQGEYDKALDYITQALKASETPSAAVLDHYGDIQFRLGNSREALKNWKKAFKLASSQGEDDSALALKIKNKKLPE